VALSLLNLRLSLAALATETMAGLRGRSCFFGVGLGYF
jgi:hypothetical protein